MKLKHFKQSNIQQNSYKSNLPIYNTRHSHLTWKFRKSLVATPWCPQIIYTIPEIERERERLCFQSIKVRFQRFNHKLSAEIHLWFPPWYMFPLTTSVRFLSHSTPGAPSVGTVCIPGYNCQSFNISRVWHLSNIKRFATSILPCSLSTLRSGIHAVLLWTVNCAYFDLIGHLNHFDECC